MNKNHTLRVATSLMLVASTAAVAATPEQASAATDSKFTDVKKGDYFHDAIVTLTDEQVLNGYGDKTFRPNVPTTRGHIAIVLTRVLNLSTSQFVAMQDMTETHDTYKYAAAAVHHGFMTLDSKNQFNPKSELTRYEYAEILMRAYNLQPTYEKEHAFKNVPKKYKEAVQAVFDHGLMHGVSTTSFGGNQNITRGQMAVTLINARALSEQAPTVSSTKTTGILSYNTISKTIETVDGDYKINESLLPLFTNANKGILQNAIITADFVGEELVVIQDIELVNPRLANVSLTGVLAAQNAFTSNNVVASNVDRVLDLGGVAIPGKITIKRERTTIRNGSVGQIIVTDEANRTLTLNNVKVKDLIVEDGYDRDFLLTLTNTVPSYVKIDRDDVQLSSNQKLPQVMLTDNAYALDLKAALGTLHLMKAGYASLYGQISIDRLLIPGEAYVYVGSPGYIKEAEILERGGELSFTSNVRFGAVTVPPVGHYGDYINYYGDLKGVIGKVTLPGSENNLFHDVIELPSKEEIERQELFDKLVDNFESSANRNQFTIVTRLNSFSTTMRDYPVHLSFTLTSGLTHLPDYTIIPTKITFKGRTTTHNFSVAELRQGKAIVNSEDQPLTLKDLSPNSDNRLNVEFDTQYPMTVRGNLTINGYSKGATEVQLNNQYIEEIQKFITSVTATESSTGVKIKKQYGTIPEQFDQVQEDVRLQLTELRKPAADSKIIPFTLTYKLGDNEQTKTISHVTLAELKSGMSLYALLDISEKKLLKENSEQVEEWDIQFKDTIDADFELLTSIQGIDVNSTTFKMSYENTAKKAVKEFDTEINKDKLTLTKTYNAIDSTLVGKAQDVKMTLTKVTTPADTTRVPFTIKYKSADGQEQTKSITNFTANDLKAGVSLYTLLGMPAPNVAAELAGKIETFEITFKEQFVGSLKLDAIVDGTVEHSTVAAMNSQVAARPSISKLELSKLNRGFKIEKTYGDIQSLANGRTQNLTFKVVSSSLPTANNSNVRFKIKYKYNGVNVEQTVNDRSLSDLKAGISIYTLLGLPLPTINDINSQKIEQIELEFLSEFVGKVEVSADVAMEQSIKKTLDASYTGVAVEKLTFNNLNAGFKIEQQFGTPISEKFYNQKLDTLLKFETSMPNNFAVPFTIQYEGVAGNVTSVTVSNKTVADLKAGVSLYTLINKTAPNITKNKNGLIEKFTVTFNDNVIGKFNVQSVAGQGTQAKVVAETGFKDVYVAETAANAFAGQADGAKLVFKRKFKDFANEIVGSALDVQLKATISNLANDDTINLAIKRNNEQERIVKNVKVSELKSGKSIYSILGITQPKLEAQQKNAEETWTIRPLEVVNGTFQLNTYQGGKLINSSSAVPFASTSKTLYSIDSFTSSFQNYQLSIDTKYGVATTDSTMKEYPVDVRLKAVSGLENEQDDREILLNIKQGTTVYPGPFKVKVKDLKAGIQLSKILGQSSLSKLGAHSNKTDQWAITFNDNEVTPFKATLNTELLVNGKAVGDVKNIAFENKAATINRYVDELTITSTEASAEFAATLKLKDRSNIAATLGYLPVDARLVISKGTLQNEKYAVTITVNSQFVTTMEVSAAALMQGVKLSSLTGVIPAKLSEHAAELNGVIHVEAIGEKQDETVSAKIDLLVGEYIAETAELKDFLIPNKTITDDNESQK